MHQKIHVKLSLNLSLNLFIDCLKLFSFDHCQHLSGSDLCYEDDRIGIDWLSSVLRPLQHSIGYMGDGFYRSKDPTNSIKVLN